jgi:hypothetical protein
VLLTNLKVNIELSLFKCSPFQTAGYETYVNLLYFISLRYWNESKITSVMSVTVSI